MKCKITKQNAVRYENFEILIFFVQDAFIHFHNTHCFVVKMLFLIEI